MEWISVDERVPDNSDIVLFWHKVWNCPVCGCINKNELIVTEKTLTTKWPLESFTHWAPLPEPPK